MKQDTKSKRHYFGNFYVELHKLQDNILSVKYLKTDAYVPTIKVQHISNGLKDVISNVIKNKYDERIFQMLSKDMIKESLSVLSKH